VTLEDVALLFRLPCSGEPWGLVTNPPPPSRGARSSSRGSPEWCAIPARQRFSVRYSTYRFFIVSVCNVSLVFEFFQASFMRDNVDKQTSNKNFEAYLLWLFGYVMFYGSRGTRCRGS
jgi:hypothetical protein